MATDDDDVPSVRVEVDGASAPILDVPELRGPSTGPSRWPVVLVVLLVAAIGGALVLLSPDSGESADGTERAAPTTAAPPTTAPASEAVGENSAAAAESAAFPRASAPLQLDDPLLLVEADAASELSQIIEVDDRFLSLASSQLRGSPQILQSADGLVWDELETTLETTSGSEPALVDWIELFATNDGLALVGAPEAQNFRTVLALSDDAVAWALNDAETISPGVPGTFAGLGQPLFVEGDSLVRLRIVEQPIEQILRGFTDVDLAPGSGICGVFRTPSADRQFELFPCTNRDSVLVDASTVLDQWDPELVLDCVADLSTRQIGVSVVFSQAELAGPGILTLGQESSQWTPTDVPVPLGASASGSDSPVEIAFVDVGVDEAEDCARFIAVEEPRGPALVVLAADGDERLVPLPFEVDNGTGPRSIGAVNIIGATAEFEDGSSHILVAFDEQLWSLNTELLTWSLLYDRAGQSTDFGPVVVSTSGNRLYQPTDEGLRILELNERFDGDLSATTFVAPIDAPDGFQVDEFDSVRVNYASDERLFVTVSFGQLWNVETPAPPIRRDRELSQDFGGVGTARVR